jgi:hypothetical protein
MRKETAVPIFDEAVVFRSHRELSPVLLCQGEGGGEGEGELLVDIGLAVTNVRHLRIATRVL